MNYQAIITDIKDIISSGQKIAYNATNKAMILTYCMWVNVLLSRNKTEMKEHNMGKL